MKQANKFGITMVGKQIIRAIDGNNASVMYPSATFLYGIAETEYSRTVDSYNRVFDRAGILIAFCGALFVVAKDIFDQTLAYRAWDNLFTAPFNSAAAVVCAGVAILLLVLAMIFLVISMHGDGRARAFDGDICLLANKKLPSDQAAMILIGEYAGHTNSLREVVRRKQKKLSVAGVFIVIAVGILFLGHLLCLTAAQ